MECSLKFGLRQRSKKKGCRVLIFGGGMGGTMYQMEAELRGIGDQNLSNLV